MFEEAIKQLKDAKILASEPSGFTPVDFPPPPVEFKPGEWVAVKDIHELDQHEPGAKLDGDKPRLALVLGAFNKALNGVGNVGTGGAKKYTDNGWQEVLNAEERYASALLRHLFAHLGGELFDPESGEPHLDHVAWNSLAISQLAHKERDCAIQESRASTY